ncbi:histone-fold-containing protein [Catenaria anguillulae PL171]|uniref:Histone-fold-containing protein n=1 Tax=Catenaria anguillulae PL171 TaxID=765915 RepID=A0A1Y2HBV3_9FUNG|nr:histone-fold-containing protein [Catenaria anguillulae PL171]
MSNRPRPLPLQPAPPPPGQPPIDPDATAKQQQQDDAEDWEAREQDRLLPIANVTRIMKKTLPENAKLSKEAKELIQECVSEFISFITSEGMHKSTGAKTKKRKTINAEDILWAMQQLSFDNHSDTMRVYLDRFREWQQAKTGKTAKRGGDRGDGSGDDPTSPTSDQGGSASASASASASGADPTAHAAAAAHMMQQQQQQFAQLMQQQQQQQQHHGYPPQQ